MLNKKQRCFSVWFVRLHPERWIRHFALVLNIFITGCVHLSGENAVRVDLREGEYLLATVQKPVSAGALAKQYLGDEQLSWVVAELNEAEKFSRGERLVIPAQYPHRLINRRGISAKGYQTVPVLCYHKFSTDQKGNLLISAQQFRQQLNYLKAKHFNVIPMSDLLAFLHGYKALPPRSVVISIDDGDKSTFEVAFPILQEYQFPATLFVYTDFIGRGGLSWDQLRTMRRTGLISVGVHSKTHANLVLSYKSFSSTDKNKRIEQEIFWPQSKMKREMGFLPTAYAYPYGDVDSSVLNRMKKSTYEVAFTVISEGNAPFTHPLLMRRSLIYGDKPFSHFVDKLKTFKSLDLTVDPLKHGLEEWHSEDHPRLQWYNKQLYDKRSGVAYFSAFQQKAQAAYRVGDYRAVDQWLQLSQLSIKADRSTQSNEVSFKGQSPRNLGILNAGFRAPSIHASLDHFVERQISQLHTERDEHVQRLLGKANGHRVSALEHLSHKRLLNVLALDGPSPQMDTVISALREKDAHFALQNLKAKLSKADYQLVFEPKDQAPKASVAELEKTMMMQEEPRPQSQSEITVPLIASVNPSEAGAPVTPACGVSLLMSTFPIDVAFQKTKEKGSHTSQKVSDQARLLDTALTRIREASQEVNVFSSEELKQLDAYYAAVRAQTMVETNANKVNACVQAGIARLRSVLAESYYQRGVRAYKTDRPSAVLAWRKAFHYASEQQRKAFQYRSHTFLKGVQFEVN